MNLKGKRVLIIQQRNWGVNVGHFLAKRLQSEGCRLAAVTYKKSAHIFHASQPDVRYEMLISNDEVFENPQKYIRGGPASLEAIAKDLGITSVWPLVFASREITRSHGQKYLFAGRQQLSDEQIVAYMQGAYAYLRKIFDEFKPDIIVAPLLAEPSHQMIYFLGKKKGIPSLTFTHSKIEKQWMAVEDPWESTGPFYKRVDELSAGAQSGNTERAKKYIDNFRSSYSRQTYVDRYLEAVPLLKRLRNELAPYRAILHWYIYPHVDCVGPLGATLDCKPPRIILRDHYTYQSRARMQRNFLYDSFDPNTKYVYYPLQVEPEMTLDLFAPNFNNQRDIVRQVALSLPDDCTLVVKDHPAMLGLRSKEYLLDVKGTPNVKLIDYRTPNIDVLKRSALVVAPNSTALFEAAFFGIPSIQFGAQGTTLKYPNVIRHTDMTTLGEVIADRIGTKLDSSEYERRLINTVAAVYDTGTSVDYDAAWYRGQFDDEEAFWNMYRKEIERLLSRGTAQK